MGACDKQWMLDVNDRYARGVGIIISLATTAMIVPIFFLKNIAKLDSTLSFVHSLTWQAYSGWACLGVSVISGILYYYFSAKWVKLAWGQEADVLWIGATEACIEHFLDWTYFFMVLGFISGVGLMGFYIATFTTHAPG